MTLTDLPRVFIALGSNQGDPVANVKAAIRSLQPLSAAPVLQSSLWYSTPVDCPPGSLPFVNAVAEILPFPGQSPETVLLALQQIENQFGRKAKKTHNEPRPLDLDLIAWGPESRKTANLVLPHPRAHLRKFVLQPLAELAPDFVFPGQSSPVKQLLDELKTSEQVWPVSAAQP